jgi:Tol biopolymer transport system component
MAARMAERWLARLERILAHQLRGRQSLVLYASHVDFEQTNTIQGELGEGTGGVTEPLRRRIILPLAGPLADTDHVIGHELVHAFQFDITTTQQMQAGQTGIERLPLWFIEGMAEYLSIGPVDPNTAMWLRDATRKEQLPTVRQLNDPRYFPYRWGQAFWAYVAGRWGDQVTRQMLDIGAASGDPEVAIQQVLGITAETLSADWHAAVRHMYGPVLDATTPPGAVGSPVVRGGRAGSMAVGPAISPDGRLLAFLSERSLLSIDLFVADAETGEVLHKLTSTASDPHYSSLQFIYSAGAWDRESRRLAVATVVDGRPALAIFDARRGRRERDVRIDGVDEIFNPTWAPDGRTLAFTGMKGGLTDLFVVELDSRRVRQLTSDPYADLQAAWAPDGSRIAFATDRFSSQLADLAIGPYRIGLIDPESGRITPAPALAGGKNMNPQWSPDSRAIYVIADHEGIPNVFRLPLDSGAVTAVTAVGTGISGITASSPALSVASRTGRIAVSVYDEGRYDIYTLPGDSRAVDHRLPGDAGALPPTTRRDDDLRDALADARTGLPPAGEVYESTDYRSGLQLEALGQPTIAFGANRFGPSIGGGISAYFSDLLGNHTLTTAVQLNSGLSSNFSIKNTAAQAAYLNQSRRWNWGMVGGQVPYLSGGVQQLLASVDGQPALVEQTIFYRQTERSAAGVLAYPFNRAQRVEFQAGFSRMSFDQVVDTQAYSLNTGRLILEESNETSLASPLNFGTTSAAMVYDTSTFGATSPVLGQRYRFEVSPTFGSLNYTGVLADYRRYVMPAQFYTVATRVMHYGRYGGDAEDARFFPLFIGQPTLVRGYDAYSFSTAECGVTVGGDCPAYTQLLGSRMLVGNVEFRFPLLRPFTGPSGGMYGPIPVEVGVFADAGVAWNRGERPAIFGGERDGVSSVGLTVRANLLGFAIGQFDFVRPLQRPGRGWLFQFFLTSGF